MRTVWPLVALAAFAAGAQACSQAPPHRGAQANAAPDAIEPSPPSSSVGHAVADGPAAPAPSERAWPATAPAAAATAPAAAATAKARIFSKARFLWIYPEPNEARAWIGYLSLGDAAPLRGGTAEQADAGAGGGKRCARWYALEPRGYVCAGEDATLDAADPDVVELVKGAARAEPWPYDYAESLGTAVYLDLPPRRRQYFRESAYHEHMAAVARARAAASEAEIARIDPDLVGVDLRPVGNAAPPFLLHLSPRAMPRASSGKDGFPEVMRGSTVATFLSFDADERGWLMAWDRGVVPRDRVRPYARSAFHGVPLGEGSELPIGFFLRTEPMLERRSDGSLAPSGESWPRYGWVGLTGEELELAGERYLVTRERGRLCRAASVRVARHRDALPERVRDAGGQGTWVDVRILEGTLVAYEGRRPVYATLVSPGRGGLPKPGKTLLETASTPVGDFVVSGKFHTATMVSNFSEKVVHAEVPYTQNFSGPYALHAAYWHDDWGTGKSGGCVNLAPIDSMRLFAWTRPRLPAGWHGWRLTTNDGDAGEPATVVSTRP